MGNEVKQKQIEEMAVDIAKRDCSLWEHCPKELKHNCVSQDAEIMLESSKKYITIATWLVNAGYRKIPENAVVLTREELKEHYVSKNLYELLQKVSISRREQLIKADEAFMRVRKETAEKFAELADEKSEYFDMGNGYIYKAVHIEDVYGICKEITEGKV